MSQFEFTIGYLEKRLNLLVQKLKTEDFNQQVLDEKLDIELAIKSLKFNVEYGISVSDTVKVLPSHTEQNYGEWFEYRIMNDHETDDVNKWTKVKDSKGLCITASPGDLLVIKSV
ncbi:hypothetical protein [Pseudoalteromonas luteoviolacea]|uniref:hypothetical protein n=1 Tax=Pseudoalteromonas luteoviolacea TaxID=43657 RepID=UPI0012699941|nr:hypothetical protein [Pseudoalteromonas luteoviolacea]